MRNDQKITLFKNGELKVMNWTHLVIYQKLSSFDPCSESEHPPKMLSELQTTFLGDSQRKHGIHLVNMLQIQMRLFFL